MDCNQVSNLLIEYIDLQLDKATNSEVEEHLRNCKNCSLEYEQTKKMFSAIEQNDDVIPGKQLKGKFQEILAAEKTEIKHKQAKTSVFIKYRIIWQVAAAVLLLFTGYFVGYNSNNSDNNEQLVSIQKDVEEMKIQMTALSLLKNESASQRIKAVNYTEEITNPDHQIIDALINTLNSDKSSNVRLAAVYSLARFKTNKRIKEAFILTLNKQDDPMVQIVIINLLVEMEEVKAVEELKILLKNKDLNETVKEQAELGVKILS